MIAYIRNIIRAILGYQVHPKGPTWKEHFEILGDVRRMDADIFERVGKDAKP